MSAEIDFRYDTTNLIRQIKDKKSLIEDGIKAARKIDLPKEIDKILIMGMGGSLDAGILIQRYFGSLNIKIINDYKTDEKINSKTAIFICSYSGETEEALHFFNSVSTTNAKIVVVTSGGTLKKNAQSKHIPVVSVKARMQPRIASTGMFFAMLTVLHNSGLIESQSKQLGTVYNTVTNEKQQDSLEDYSKSLAEKIGDNIPLVYSSSQLKEVAYTWKTNFNETGKVHSFTNTLPEMCHNELNAFRSGQEYYAIILLDETDMKRMKDRASILRGSFNSLGIENTTIMVKGPSVLSKLFSTIMLGELTAYYLALMHGRDPAQIERISEFKRELSKKKFYN